LRSMARYTSGNSRSNSSKTHVKRSLGLLDWLA
jgi:hypothetical protein